MTDSASWIRITACANIPVREGRVTFVHGWQIAIFNLGDRFLAVDNRCPHRGGPLAEGIVSGTTVVCPLHAWKIDLLTGSVVSLANSAACVATFPTRIVDETVEVQVPLNPAREEPLVVDCIHRDQPIRWVRRKPNTPFSAPSEVS